ncbi:MAG: hypothetical protein A2Z15_02515 [Chloroflexi bacterium RBG_16_50_11]|nr:MAG: hypothetical protein A2Z15_02515 [Chloroflexi bacterium RBG_16_50_11]
MDNNEIILLVTVSLAVVLIAFVSLNFKDWTSKKQRKLALANENPSGTDIKFADPKYQRSNSPGWRDMPVVINSETIARELGWTLERYKIYQDNQRRSVLKYEPDFSNELHPDEIILRLMASRVHTALGNGWYWDILLTDKRMLYKFTEIQATGKPAIKTRQYVASHWYVNIAEVKPQWSGDLGSHVEGGGGYVSGWVWNGTGGAWGQQNPVYTVQHKMGCTVTIIERNGEWQEFPFDVINNKDKLEATRDFIGMLNKLVNLAWKKPTMGDSPARVEVPAPPKRIVSNNTPSGEKDDAGDFDKRAVTLEKYAALKEKGLITEEEYNQQKKKILGQ